MTALEPSGGHPVDRGAKNAHGKDVHAAHLLDSLDSLARTVAAIIGLPHPVFGSDPTGFRSISSRSRGQDDAVMVMTLAVATPAFGIDHENLAAPGWSGIASSMA